MIDENKLEEDLLQEIQDKSALIKGFQELIHKVAVLTQRLENFARGNGYTNITPQIWEKVIAVMKKLYEFQGEMEGRDIGISAEEKRGMQAEAITRWCDSITGLHPFHFKYKYLF